MMKNYFILRSLSKCVWYVGSGNFWYEEGVVNDENTIRYRCFQVILFSMYILMTIFEILGALFGNFPKDEQGDCVTFSFAHSIILMKLFTILRNKKLIKDLNRKLVEVCEEHEDQELIQEQYKILKISVSTYFVMVYGTMVCFITEGFMKMKESSHFATIITYYPPYEDNSQLATVVRISTTCILGVMMLSMIFSADIFTMIYLIMFKYKIMTLRKYLERMRNTFDAECEINLSVASQNLKDGLIKAIGMHREIIRIREDLDAAFSVIMALQLCLCLCSVVSLMLQLALTTKLTLGVTLKISLFVFALYLILALFLCNAGEIHYQSSLLSGAIFNCGWHMCESQRSIAPLVLLSLLQAQRPLVMKAFKMILLTHSTFVQVVRTTYSVFALFYARNK